LVRRRGGARFVVQKEQVVMGHLHELELEALGLAARAQATVVDTLGVELDLINRREGREVRGVVATQQQQSAARRTCSELEGESRERRGRQVGSSSDASQGEEEPQSVGTEVR